MIIFHLAAHLNPARRIRHFPVICVVEDSRAACAFTHLPRIHTEKIQTRYTARTFSVAYICDIHVSAIPKNNSLTIHVLGHVKQPSVIEYMRIPKVQATLRIRTVFLEPVLFAHVRRNAHRNIDSTESPNIFFFFSFFLTASLISTFCSHLRQCVKLVNPVWQRQRCCMPYLHLSPHKCKQYHR